MIRAGRETRPGSKWFYDVILKSDIADMLKNEISFANVI